MPEVLDRLDLGEEAVTPDVERQPSRSTVWLMPPTTSDASATTTGLPAFMSW